MMPPAAAGLIDSHAHLDAASYGAELPEVIARARAALSHAVLIGQWAAPAAGEPDGLSAARATVSQARADRSFFSATAGIHPHDAAAASDRDLEALEALCSDDAVVAVGECGLDYHYDRSPRDVQRTRFVEQLEMARRLRKPVVIHTREADADTAEILTHALGPDGGVIHCFTSDWAAAQRYLALGLHISLSGVITFKSAEAVRDAAIRIPLDRLLVETDCPFLAPVPHRGKRNEPSFVRLTAERLAELRGLPLAEVAAATSANARRVLRLPAALG